MYEGPRSAAARALFAGRCSSLVSAWHCMGCTSCFSRGVGSTMWEAPCPTEHAPVRRRVLFKALARFEQHMATSVYTKPGTLNLHSIERVEITRTCLHCITRLMTNWRPLHAVLCTIIYAAWLTSHVRRQVEQAWWLEFSRLFFNAPSSANIEGHCTVESAM